MRLYLRFYLTLLCSLIFFALAVALLWHKEGGPFEQAGNLLGRAVQNTLPSIHSAPAMQQAALQRLTEGLNLEAGLFDDRGRSLASVGRSMGRPPMNSNVNDEVRVRIQGNTTYIHLPDGRWFSIRTTRFTDQSMNRLHSMLVMLAIAIGIVAFPFVRHQTRRLERLQQTVELLGEGDLSARVKVEGHDEVARLAVSFNQTASQIESLVTAQRTLLANASHELRTPLARIQLTVGMMSDVIEEKRRAGLRKDIEELDGLIEEILLASRLDAMSHNLDRRPTDLLALAAEECARYDDVELEGTSIIMNLDARLMRRLLRNLLENARLHGKAPTQVRIVCESDMAIIIVWDSGPGIPVAEFEKIFLPFYRRSDSAPNTGTGLGLSLVNQIAIRHGGSAICESRSSGRSQFVIRLPVTEHYQANTSRVTG